MSKSGVSVIICCYNSAERLPNTIKHLALQEVPDSILWEVIVVNNASTDNTTSVSNYEWHNYTSTACTFKIVDETKAGLSHARKKGVQSSNFNYIIFCDDDNWLDKNYLVTAYRILSANQKIAALGGQSIAVSTIPLPDWFEDSKNNYAVGKQAENSGNVSYRKHLWGSGIIIRKDIYTKAFLDFPSLLTGRKADELSSGEDSEMCMRFLLMGYSLYYAEQLTFMHFIEEKRLTEDYNKKLVAGFLKAHDVLKLYAMFIDIKNENFRGKYMRVFKSVARLFISFLTKVKRWDIEAEKVKIYSVTGFPFLTIDKNILLISRFKKKYGCSY